MLTREIERSEEIYFCVEFREEKKKSNLIRKSNFYKKFAKKLTHTHPPTINLRRGRRRENPKNYRKSLGTCTVVRIRGNFILSLYTNVSYDTFVYSDSYTPMIPFSF